MCSPDSKKNPFKLMREKKAADQAASLAATASRPAPSSVPSLAMRAASGRSTFKGAGSGVGVLT